MKRSSATAIGNFWAENKDDVSLSVTWDAFKATLRGSISELIRKLIENRRFKNVNSHLQKLKWNTLETRPLLILGCGEIFLANLI